MKFKLKAWAYCVDDGHKPEITPWGCGDYWQLPVFHSKKDAKAWRKEHPEQVIDLKLQRVMIASIPNIEVSGRLPARTDVTSQNSERR